MKITMPRATNHLKPISKVKNGINEAGHTVELNSKPLHLEPTGKGEDMDFSRIYTNSKEIEADYEDIPELEAWNE
jgi:hypothetical protein